MSCTIFWWWLYFLCFNADLVEFCLKLKFHLKKRQRVKGSGQSAVQLPRWWRLEAGAKWNYIFQWPKKNNHFFSLSAKRAKSIRGLRWAQMCSSLPKTKPSKHLLREGGKSIKRETVVACFSTHFLAIWRRERVSVRSPTFSSVLDLVSRWLSTNTHAHVRRGGWKTGMLYGPASKQSQGLISNHTRNWYANIFEMREKIFCSMWKQF